MSARTASGAGEPAARRSRARAADLFAALGDETRLQLIDRLGQGKALSIASLGEGAKITRQAITKHLHVLEGAGFVRGIRFGREQLWELERARLNEAAQALEVLSKKWDEALGRLAAMVEE